MSGVLFAVALVFGHRKQPRIGIQSIEGTVYVAETGDPENLVFVYSLFLDHVVSCVFPIDIPAHKPMFQTLLGGRMHKSQGEYPVC